MARGRHADPDDSRPTDGETWLRRLWVTATFLALLLGIFVVPIQFADAHHTRLAQQIERDGGESYPVVEVRQKVERSRGGHHVDAQVATYRDERGTPTVRLLGYDQSAVVLEQEGWFVVPLGSRGQQVYVAADGRSGFLAEDYRIVLNGEFDDLYRAALAPALYCTAATALVALAYGVSFPLAAGGEPERRRSVRRSS